MNPLDATMAQLQSLLCGIPAHLCLIESSEQLQPVREGGRCTHTRTLSARIKWKLNYCPTPKALRAHLKDAFGLEGDPFVPYAKGGWRS